MEQEHRGLLMLIGVRRGLPLISKTIWQFFQQLPIFSALFFFSSFLFFILKNPQEKKIRKTNNFYNFDDFFYLFF